VRQGSYFLGLEDSDDTNAIIMARRHAELGETVKFAKRWRQQQWQTLNARWRCPPHALTKQHSRRQLKPHARPRQAAAHRHRRAVGAPAGGAGHAAVVVEFDGVHAAGHGRHDLERVAARLEAFAHV